MNQTTEAKTRIQKRFMAAQRVDREKRTAALQAVSKETAPLFREIEAECALTGHEWRFDSWNFNRTYAWDKCIWCGKSEGADKHAEALNV